MGRRAREAGGDHGEEFLEGGGDIGGVGRHVGDVGLGDGAAEGHFAAHEDEEVEGGGAGLFVDFFGRDDDFGQDGGDEVQGFGRHVRDDDGDGGEAVAAGGGGGGGAGGQEEGLEGGVAVLQGEDAGGGGGEAGEELVGFFLELRVAGLGEDEGSEGEEGGEAGKGEVDGEGDDEVHEGVAGWWHFVGGLLLLLFVGLGLRGCFCEGCFEHRCNTGECLH